MIPDIRDNAVPLLWSADVAVGLGPAQNLGFEFVDSVEDRHPALLDRLDAQPEIRAEFGVGLAAERCNKEFLFRRT